VIVAVIADTHIPRRARDLPPSAWRRIDTAEVVIHAGDVTAPSFLEALQRHTAVHAVRGNNDIDMAGLPDTLELTLSGVPIAITHDAGPRTARRQRISARFPAARIVVFGHSHIPFLEDEGALMLLNPGSPTDRRRMPTFTMAMLDVRDGEISSAGIVDLGLERAAR
jgi:putative phosphoesterase